MEELIKLWGLPYEQVFDEVNAHSYEQKVSYIKEEIWQDWADIYRGNSTALTALGRFPYEDFVFLYDDTGELVYHKKVNPDDVPEGRVS